MAYRWENGRLGSTLYGPDLPGDGPRQVGGGAYLAWHRRGWVAFRGASSGDKIGGLYPTRAAAMRAVASGVDPKKGYGL